ncbi:hypothetical protein ACF3NA_09035 [Alkanindiges sp. WGS2144]|uniref:hypothetical protein n=1 Tax=Alkanindiges sp. WGS2144 TaxID=3366808 RepID=UPI0037539E66
MGWFSNAFSAVSSAWDSSSSKSETPEDNASYKKHAADIRNFELDPKLVKQSVSSKKSSAQLSQIPDELDEIESLDDVKKHFQEK